MSQVTAPLASGTRSANKELTATLGAVKSKTNHLDKKDDIKQQECIPVGCMPLAYLPYPVVFGRGSAQPPWSCDL